MSILGIANQPEADLTKLGSRQDGEPSRLSDRILNRALRVHLMHTDGRSVDEICAENRISKSQVYRDLDVANEFLREQFRDDVVSLLMDQVEARNQAIGVLWQEVHHLQELPVSAQRANAISKLLLAIGQQNLSIEQLLGLRDGRGNGLYSHEQVLEMFKVQEPCDVDEFAAG